ncbi:MAG: hypothetical protein ACT4O3_08325 [Elusimicrobiota bacterium]
MGKRDKIFLGLLILAGLAARLAWVAATRGDAAHPDLASFLAPAAAMSHPYDASWREPFFVWWLWLLLKLGAESTAALRAAGGLWFAPSAALLFLAARRLLGRRAAWPAAALFAFLPAQIQSDALGLRQSVETAALLGLLFLLLETPALPGRLRLTGAAGAAAALVLTRISHLSSVFLLSAAAAWRARAWRPLALPAFVLLAAAPFFHNAKVRFGDPLYTVNLTTYFHANMEYIGRPGFPATWEEWQKDVYKPSLTFRQWAFEYHTPREFAEESARGMVRCLWIFWEKIYFSVGLATAAKWFLLVLYAAGLASALFFPPWRFALAAYLLLLWPYAFPSHVFWAGRFFVPFSPFAVLFAVLGAREAEKAALKILRRFFPSLKLPRFLPLLRA